MLSLFSAILALMLQGPIGSDVMANGECASSQRLLASLQRISSDPMLSRMIAELFEAKPEPALATSPSTAQPAEPKTPVPFEPLVRLQRAEFARTVRFRAGP